MPGACGIDPHPPAAPATRDQPLTPFFEQQGTLPRVCDKTRVTVLNPTLNSISMHGPFSISKAHSPPSLAFKARLMMMSAPFYKVSILTFSPCGGFVSRADWDR